MIYAHQNNIETKIRDNYKELAEEIRRYKNEKYEPFKANIEALHFSDNYEVFVSAAELINNYRGELKRFARENSITFQSKFESSFLEEINAYLFRELPKIQDGTYDAYNSGIYKNLKIRDNLEPLVANKDVDFCIGKEATLSIEGRGRRLIVPKICVEVKTYLDSTMLGEVTASSRMIKIANPDAHTYILAGYNGATNTQLLVAEKEAALDDIFFLQANEESLIDPRVLYTWWKEISEVMNNERDNNEYTTPGRMFKFLTEYRAFVEAHPLEEEN